MCYRNGYGSCACGTGNVKETNGKSNSGHCKSGCGYCGNSSAGCCGKCSDCKKNHLPESEKERKEILFGMTEKDLSNAINVLDTLAQFLGIVDEYDDEEYEIIPPLMIGVMPGEPMQILTEEEAYDFLPCFGEDDLIREAPDVDLLMSCNKSLIFEVEGRRYLDGAALIYEVDDEGEIQPLTIEDIYRVKEMLARRTVLVKEEGDEMPVISLD